MSGLTGITDNQPDRAWLGVLVGLSLTLAMGAFAWTLFGASPRQGISSSTLYSTRFPDQRGNSIALAQWQGKVLLINFWAAWCEPCRKEIPHLIAAQTQFGAKGLQVLGIAVDKAENVIPYSMQLGINYPLLIDEASGMALSMRLGNRAGIVPFTALVDRQGQLLSVTAGPLSENQLESMLRGQL